MALLKALAVVPAIKALLAKETSAPLLGVIASKIQDLTALETLLSQSLNEERARNG